MFQLAYFQMVGAGKARNQDALFDGTAVRQVRLHKTRVSEADDAVRLVVADGVSSSPAAHLASWFWLDAFVREGDAEGRFLRRLHGSFCDTLAGEYFGSSSTFASAVVEADGLCRICNVGDSRVYHISAEGRWRQVSHTDSFTLQRGEAVLVCSDGLHDALSHERLEALWNVSPSLSDKLEALRRAVKRVPYHDDCSAAVCLWQR